MPHSIFILNTLTFQEVLNIPEFIFIIRKYIVPAIIIGLLIIVSVFYLFFRVPHDSCPCECHKLDENEVPFVPDECKQDFVLPETDDEDWKAMFIENKITHSIASKCYGYDSLYFNDIEEAFYCGCECPV